MSLFLALLVFSFVQKSVIGDTQQVWLQECRSETDCLGLKNATCTNGFCRCNEFLTCDTQILVNRIGGECDASRICNAERSRCGPERKCVCEDGFVASADSRRCLRAVGAGCAKSEDCSSTGSSRCVDSKCECLETHVDVNRVCLRVARGVGDGCEDGLQCTAAFGEGAKCHDGGCQCRYEYHFDAESAKCVKDKVLGDICGKSEDCHQPGQEVSRLICILGECKCKVGYAEENGYCIERNGATGPWSHNVLTFYLFLFVVTASVVF